MSTAYSCVVDRDPTFTFQALVLVGTLLDRAGVDRRDIHVHLTGGCDPLCRDVFEALGVQVSEVEAFAGLPHCNKLRQLRSPALLGYDRVVLCDCDLAFDGSIAAEIEPLALGAKTVDLPNPPLLVLLEVLRVSGLRRVPVLVPTTFSPDGAGYRLNGGEVESITLEHNCNGGIYVLGRDAFRALGNGWQRWAEWLRDRPRLLGSWHLHADQVAFALATWELGLAVTPLDLALNCPLHLPGPWSEALAKPPKVLHFHRCFDPRGRIAESGGPALRGAIRRVNASAQRLLKTLASERPELHSRIAAMHRSWLEGRAA